MKIMQVTPRYAPSTGGVETHVQEISERFASRGHEVTVTTADAGQSVTKRERRNGVRIERHRGLAPGNTIHAAPGIVRTVRRAGADVIHAHNFHSLPILFAAIGRQHSRFVVTPHYHGASANGLRNGLLSVYQPFGRWALHRAETVVTVSEWERARVRDDFDVPATVIPNGLDVSRFANADPVERSRPYLLSVGRLERYKGVQHLIRALSELPEYDLLIAGSGPYRTELERVAAKAGIEDRVDFLGYVADDSLPGLYAGADAYVTFSTFESYGMTVGEALASGTPAVVLVEGALADWTRRSGVVGVRSWKPETVKEGVKEAVNLDPVRETLPDWSTIVTELVEVYTT